MTYIPSSSSTPLMLPEHFLSQGILEFLQLPAFILYSHLHVFFPILKLTFPLLLSSDLPAGACITMAIRKSGTHWHPLSDPSPPFPPAILVIAPLGHIMSMSAGHLPSIIGQTLENPSAQVTALLVIGQLQSQSHSPLPSGHLHLHWHCIPSPTPPDPDPVMGTGVSPDPDPDPGMGPDPDPGIGPDPDPDPGMGPDPDPVPVGVGASVGDAAQAQLEMDPFPFFILSVKEHPLISTVPCPEHFLSHVAF